MVLAFIIALLLIKLSEHNRDHIINFLSTNQLITRWFFVFHYFGFTANY